MPKYFAVTDEVATMALLDSLVMPMPEVYGHSPTSDNMDSSDSRRKCRSSHRKEGRKTNWLIYGGSVDRSCRSSTQGEEAKITRSNHHQIVSRTWTAMSTWRRHSSPEMRSPDSNLHIVRVIDWQNTSVLPLFSLPVYPNNYRTGMTLAKGLQSMAPPSLPEEMDDLDEAQENKRALPSPPRALPPS
ncbi:hypothetical protein FPV67DRAFT_1452627 [Lyophyllum atratum]|nr:hypothetical protein FPV67DRAFT_1452627 [Lyophyllum atratum]